MLTRASGILLHPTSLPGPHGIGDLGEDAYRWVDFLAQAGQSYWQVLPLGPTGFGDSPYQCFSAFAGNPLLIDLNQLVRRGWLSPEDAQPDTPFPENRVDYGAVVPFKRERLHRAYEGFLARSTDADRDDFRAFCAAEAYWLDDFALFMALKEHFRSAWTEWPREVRLREPEALAAYRARFAAQVEEHQFIQWVFFRQWDALKAHAHARGVRIIGDIPIFVAFDSADVWAYPELFHLDENGHPTVVAGVPPDYFSPTGQLWGNPLYRWDVMAEQGYRWWVERFRSTLRLVDLVRLDHFRGFEAYWEIPAGMPTAEVGRWVKGPGDDLFRAVRDALGEVPVIAEDLGFITPEVKALRERWGFPGMKVLQFAFSGPDNEYLPHNYTSTNWVVYTGTHDNDTTVGWFHSLDEGTRAYVLAYLARDGSDIAWDLMRLAWMSVAVLAIAPMQDVLRLGSEARMNTPGQAWGNWSWRFTWSQVPDWVAGALAEMTRTYGRAP